MIEVCPGIFVGNQDDYDFRVAHETGWAVVHACKEPYHRQALGYSGRAAPQNHPEYLVARRGNRLILNLVDVPNPAFFRAEVISLALDFIDEARKSGLKVLIHCNEGVSRSPSIAIIYLAARAHVLQTESLEAAEAQFREIYPNYYPGAGIRAHLLQYWDKYRADGAGHE